MPQRSSPPAVTLTPRPLQITSVAPPMCAKGTRMLKASRNGSARAASPTQRRTEHADSVSATASATATNAYGRHGGSVTVATTAASTSRSLTRSSTNAAESAWRATDLDLPLSQVPNADENPGNEQRANHAGKRR